MSLTKFTGNTNVISELPDSPTQSASELKAKFDEAGTAIKEYLNETLTEETEQLVATEKSSLQVTIQNLATTLNATITNSINSLRTELQNYANAQILADNKKRYPVGKILMSTKNTNPSTYLGFGTWQLWGSGRVPVGVNTSDTAFNTVEKTGGEKTHTLTISEMPEHSHIGLKGVGLVYAGSGSDGNGLKIKTDSNDGRIYTKVAGEGQAHNNLQPYITCYMWKRVS